MSALSAATNFFKCYVPSVEGQQGRRELQTQSLRLYAETSRMASRASLRYESTVLEVGAREVTSASKVSEPIATFVSVERTSRTTYRPPTTSPFGRRSGISLMDCSVCCDKYSGELGRQGVVSSLGVVDG